MKEVIELYRNQVKAAEEVVSNFNVGNRYVILNAPTQSGKTGVIHGVINIIDNHNIDRIRLGIEKIYYLTADNQNIRSQTEERFDYSCHEFVFKKDVNTFFLKNSDMKRFLDKRIEYNFNNSLIFIDESHYGTKKENNKLPQFLKESGIEYMTANDELEKYNTYILSVSATAYKEMINDASNIKQIVNLKVGKDYKGIKEFYENGILKSIDSNEMLKNPALFKSFVDNEIIPHLIKTRKRRRKKKFVIIRSSNRTDINYKEMFSDKFRVVYMDSNNKSQSDMYKEIKTVCKHNEIKSFLMIVIKGRFRMGESFEDEWKDYCGVVIDYSSGEIETTEQGLLGRFCGYVGTKYRTDDDWKDMRIYISTEHLNALVKYYVDGILETPLHYKESEVKVWGKSIKDGSACQYAPNVELLRKNGIKQYDVTDVLTKKQTERLKNYQEKYKPYELQRIIKEVIKKHKDIDNKYIDYLDGGCRREPNKEGKFNSIKTVDGGKHRPELRKAENYGKLVMKSLLITNLDEKIYLEIQETIVDKYIVEKVSKVINQKRIKTYDTTRIEIIPQPKVRKKNNMRIVA